MNKFIEALIGEAFKSGLRKATGLKEERHKGSFLEGCGCFLWVIAWAIGLPIAISHGDSVWTFLLIVSPFLLTLLATAPGCLVLLAFMGAIVYFGLR
ncbi:hypothetical protein D3C87_1216060 [compost metagenome]